MKKILLVVLSVLVATPLVALGAQLWEYGSFNERAEMSVNCGITRDISEYRGLYEQNIDLLQCYKERLFNSDLFGGQRPSDFSTTLSENLSATASTTEEISVASMVTTDGRTLTSADVGDYVCFHINPGASNDELVCCSGGISGTEFVDCSRGMGFYTNAVVSGNENAHSIGELVVISNDDPWLVEQYTANDDTETITGIWTYQGADSGVVKLYIGDSSTYLWMSTSTGSFGFATSTSGQLSWSSDGTTFTGVPPLTLSLGELRLSTSTLSGLRLDNDGKLQVGTSTGSGIYVDTDNTFKVATTSDFAWTGTHSFSGNNTNSGTNTFSATTTFSANLIANGFVKTWTAGETITANKAVYSTNTVAWLADDTAVTSTLAFIGFSLNDVSADETLYVQTGGIFTGLSSLTKGFNYYVNASGAIGVSTSTSGTFEGLVGRAIGDAELDMEQQYGDQFILSRSDTSDVIEVPQQARKAIVYATHSNVDGGSKCEVILTKIGKTSASCSDTFGVGDSSSVAITWNPSANTITLVASGSGASPVAAGTAYFYR